ncbi:MAG: nucleotide pyrophosphatase, partial [Candidatus Aminicenantes bacterium]|nr:nucleotide pyrophosphatase [Candidatus Aminicenantes bacterium]
ENAPDLIVGYNEGYRASWDGVTGIVNAVVIDDNTKAWSGDHCIDPALVPGVLFSNLKIKTASPSIMDIAPTVLELFGLTPPAHMDGRGLVDIAGLPGAKQRKPS